MKKFIIETFKEYPLKEQVLDFLGIISCLVICYLMLGA